MPIFESIPKIADCCYCFSLKAGSMVIAVLGIASLIPTLTIISIPMCPDNTDIPMVVGRRIENVYALAALFLFFASAQFLVGLIIDNGFTATVFLYAAASYILTTFVHVAYTVFSVATYGGCGYNYNMVPMALTFFAAIYSMFVVRSQRDEMGD